jgi:hypothetical protein
VTPFDELQTKFTVTPTVHDIKFLGKRAEVYFNILHMPDKTDINRIFSIKHVTDFTEYTIDNESRQFRIL